MNKKIEFKIDFKALRDWRSDDANKFPVLCFIDAYKALNIAEEAGGFMKSINKQLCPLEHLFINFTTLSKIHDIIHESWEKFNIDILGDEQIVWKEGQSHEMRKRAKKVKAQIRNSLNADELDYCPNLDDSLDDDVIIFQYSDEDDKVVAEVKD